MIRILQMGMSYGEMHHCIQSISVLGQKTKAEGFGFPNLLSDFAINSFALDLQF